MKARVRLCKGAYLEPPAVAFPDKADVDRNYVRLMERLLAAGNYPGIATHDEAIIAHARDFVRREGIGTDRFEFQMLYGVRRDLQEQPPRRRATACGSTSPSGRSGILTSCGGWRSGPPTSPSSSATSCESRYRDGERADAGRLHGQARAGGGLRRQRRPGLLGRHLRRRGAGRARPLRRRAAVRPLVARRRPAGRPRRDRDRWPGAAPRPRPRSA